MNLSCVILNYNDADTVGKLVRRIRDYKILGQIVIVDNASTDGSMEKLEPLRGGNVSVIRAEKNGGYGAGNNLGVRYAAEHGNAAHVLIANPDVFFSEGCLIKMLRVFRNHPDVGIVAAVMHDAGYGKLRNGWRLHGFVGELLSMGPVSRRLFGRFLDYPKSRFRGRKAAYVDAVHGSMLMVDTEKFLGCGGYDEGIFLYQEEAVLGQRMRAFGGRTALLLNCSYRHEHSASISKTYESQLARQRLREESTLYYLRHYLSVNRVQEMAAKLWFWGIRTEIRAAKVLGMLPGR